MTTEDKTILIVGVSLAVIGLAGLTYLEYRIDKAEQKRSEELKEQYRQRGWEMIQKSRMFTSASPEDKIKMFDQYWKTTGGVRTPN